MSEDPSPDEFQEEIATLLYGGKKIEAIKRYREETGKGLKESKEFIDALEATLRENDPNFPNASGCSVRAAAFLLGAGLISAAAVRHLDWV